MGWDKDGEHWEPSDCADYSKVWRVVSGGKSSRGPGWVQVHLGGVHIAAWSYSEREAAWFGRPYTWAPAIPAEVMRKVSELRRDPNSLAVS